MARGSSRGPEYREVRQDDLAGGLNDRRNEAKLDPSQTPACLNVDYNRDSVRTTGGAIKFNNEPAPGGGLRTHATLAPLYVTPQSLIGTATDYPIEVPQRGALYFGYQESSDIGGRFDYEGDPLAGSATFHNRRGTSFEVNVSFQLPPEEKLYEAPTVGAGSPATPTTFNPPHGFDQALDECVCVLQKGGDRTAPMSWALAIVNVGAGVGITNIPAQRPSNYCLAFIWYDAPQWGEHATTLMKYNLTSGQSPVGGAAATFCTQAYRTILIGKFIEPGRDYSVSLQVSMDTGSPGGVATNTSWNRDGKFKVFVWEDRRNWWYATAANTALGVITQTSSDTGSAARLEVVRGPQDSLEYLCCYGIRYAGRDAMFAGLGQRFVPWAACGFIPFGSDCTPLRYGGFSMQDRSATTVADLYVGANYTLTATHTAGDAYVVVNHQGLSNGNTNGGFDPKVALSSTMWEGLGASRNDEALRGYRLVTTADWAAALRGGIMSILSYTEVGASYRVTILDGANAGIFPTWVAQEVLVQCWRWHQRDLVVGQISISLTPTDYLASDAMVASRRKIGLRMSHAIGDPTDERLKTLVAYWPCDDAGESYLREVMSGGLRSGFRIPFGNGVGPGGTRGKNLAFISGEGEAITLNLTESEVFVREMERMLRGFTQGFGFEITCVFTEAFYALQTDVTLTNDAGVTFTGAQPTLVPDIVTLDVETNEGRSNAAEPLLTLGFRAPLQSTDGTPFKYPAGFGVTTAVFGDSDTRSPIQPSALQPWYVDSSPAPHNRYDLTAPWVGKTVTIQVGVQASAVLGEYDVYIAMMPKSAFLPQDGDPSNVEMQYWTDSEANTSADGAYAGTAYYSAAHLNLRPKDIARAVLTVGGGRRAKLTPTSSDALGIHELNARMLLDEIRWFVASPSGELGTYASQVATLTSRNGKLEGTNCLPPRELTADDMLQPLGANLRSVDVTQNSVSVLPPPGSSFSTEDPRTSIGAVKSCYLRLVSDDTFLAEEERLGEVVANYQYILTATAASITLATGYVGKTRSNAQAGVFRLAGYTAFADDVRDKPLLLGRGGGYSDATENDEVLLTSDLWSNVAIPGDAWKLRVYSPLGAQGSEELLPAWTRGMVFERRLPDDGILGVYGWNGTIYAGVRGAIYEADDRWRADGPSDSLKRSLAFRAKVYPAGISGPLQNDSLLFTDTSKARYVASATDDYAWVYDAWVKLDSLRNYQTLVWLGSLGSDTALSAGATANKIQYWWRFNNGRPEFVFGSTATYDGTNRPEKGLFVAQGGVSIPPNEWTHVRISIASSDSGVNVRLPYIQINGKTIDVTVNAVENGLSGEQWISTGSVVSAATGSGAPTVILVGAARDSYRAPDPTLTWGPGVVGQGVQLPPQRIQGMIHALGGRLALLTITRQPMWEGTGGPADFDPFLVTYDNDGVYTGLALGIQPLGVGHKVNGYSTSTPGVIYSSPFVSVFHEMGTSNRMMSFAEYGSQLYVTNGGKPVLVFPGDSDA